MLNPASIPHEELQPAVLVQFERAARALRRRYLVAVITTVLLVLISFTLLFQVLDRHAPVNAYIIHVVGRQRMLSQRLCKAALILVTAPKGRDPRDSQAEIQTALHDWQQSHQYLLHNPLLQVDQLAGLLKTHLSQLNPEYLAMVAAAQHMLQLSATAAPKDELWPDIDQLLAHEGPYLTTMERIVQLFAEEAAARDAQVRRLLVWMRAAVLLTLLIEALLVFRPGLRYLEAAVRKTRQAWALVYRRRRELSTLLGALPDLIVRCQADGTFLGTHAGHDVAAKGLIELLSGPGLKHLLSQSLAAEYDQCFARALSAGGVQWFECKIREGSADRHIEMRIFALHAEEVIVLMRDVTAQRQIERRMLKAVDQEQQRIGRELHDGASQSLSGLNLVLQSALQKMRGGGTLHESEVAMYARFTEQSVADIRQVVRGLVPPELDALGLEVGLRRMVEMLATLHAVEYFCEISLAGYEPSADVALQIYRITQEALGNALRHGRPSRVGVMLTIKRYTDRGQGHRELELEIRDNGQGLPQKFRRADGPIQLIGLGLQTMAYRAQCIGALLRVDSGPADGTVIRCQLLLAEDRRAASSDPGAVLGGERAVSAPDAQP